MSEKWKLKQSRDNWKQKAIERGNQARAHRKEIVRIKSERDQFKQKAEMTMIELEQQSHQMPHRGPSKRNLSILRCCYFWWLELDFEPSLGY